MVHLQGVLQITLHETQLITFRWFETDPLYNKWKKIKVYCKYFV